MAFPVSAENKATLERPCSAPDPCSFRIKSRAPVELHLSTVWADIRKTLSSSASFLGQTSCPYPVCSCLQSRARSRRACSPPPRFLPVGTFATAVNDRAGCTVEHERANRPQTRLRIYHREPGIGLEIHATGSWGARLWTDLGALPSNRPSSISRR
jgi:hypothetical protein